MKSCWFLKNKNWQTANRTIGAYKHCKRLKDPIKMYIYKYYSVIYNIYLYINVASKFGPATQMRCGLKRNPT